MKCNHCGECLGHGDEENVDGSDYERIHDNRGIFLAKKCIRLQKSIG